MLSIWNVAIGSKTAQATKKFVMNARRGQPSREVLGTLLICILMLRVLQLLLHLFLRHERVSDLLHVPGSLVDVDRGERAVTAFEQLLWMVDLQFK